MIARHLAAAFLVLLGLFVPGARAQGAPTAPPTAAAVAAAKSHFERGVALVDQKRYDAALVEFAAGYELSGRPLFLFNMGECARIAGQPDQAHGHYQAYLAAEPAGAFAATARSRLAELGRAGSPAEPPGAQPPLIPTPAEAVRDRPVPPDGPVVVGPAAPPPARSLWSRRWPVFVAVGAAVVAGGVTAYALTAGDELACGSSCARVDLR